ncbi:hypothetical protein [Algibacter pacificus]|uniref:hypothetical protein n=1 Tax=Algibacter pacificus TaxID=2599389 RepID=UPI0011CB882B|nr:hypothetical protein [Algibacter pacificus]
MKKIILVTLLAVAVFGNLTLSNTDNSVSINLSQLIANAQDSSEDASNPPPVGGKRAVVHDGRRNDGRRNNGEGSIILNGYRLAPVKQQSGTTTHYLPGPSSIASVQRPIYHYVDCCVNFNQNTACDNAGEDEDC